ncbi:MAG: hypothetical protein R3229_03835 [Alphaproteobacteria bacterium]|nr:hypothetical protein [Alphaproteobacteria bacterium]
MAVGKPRKSGAKGEGSLYWGMVTLGAIAAGLIFALPTMLVLAVGILPTVVAAVVDLHAKKYAAWSVGFLNCAGLMPYLGNLWVNDHTVAGALAVLTDLTAWLVVYGAAAVGWAVYLGMPTIGAVILDLQNQSHIRKLRSERRKIVDEWGQDAAGGAAD